MKKLLFILVLLVVSMSSASAQDATVPMDPAVRKGVLPNGLTYYLRHNEWPEKRAFFYIAQKVGSIQEEEDQRGLAHFLEHMCFNGTTNFPGDHLKQYLETIGVKFGENLNAYTSSMTGATTSCSKTRRLTRNVASSTRNGVLAVLP